MTKLRVYITLRNGLLDPQGQAVAQALQGQGFKEVMNARQGKVIDLELADGLSPDAAKTAAEKMCQQLLANPVMEDYRVEIL